ncbi:MAG: zinc ribbon domain-containing protein [Burkholderiales bacterium]|jgi:putative FmdB family regulatory protein
MPTYDYRCNKCGHEFERIEPLSEHQRKHTCPKCRSEKVDNMITPFYARTSRKS